MTANELRETVSQIDSSSQICVNVLDARHGQKKRLREMKAFIRELYPNWETDASSIERICYKKSSSSAPALSAYKPRGSSISEKLKHPEKMPLVMFLSLCREKGVPIHTIDQKVRAFFSEDLHAKSIFQALLIAWTMRLIEAEDVAIQYQQLLNAIRSRDCAAARSTASAATSAYASQLMDCQTWAEFRALMLESAPYYREYVQRPLKIMYRTYRVVKKKPPNYPVEFAELASLYLVRGQGYHRSILKQIHAAQMRGEVYQRGRTTAIITDVQARMPIDLLNRHLFAAGCKPLEPAHQPWDPVAVAILDLHERWNAQRGNSKELFVAAVEVLCKNIHTCTRVPIPPGLYCSFPGIREWKTDKKLLVAALLDEWFTANPTLRADETMSVFALFPERDSFEQWLGDLCELSAQALKRHREGDPMLSSHWSTVRDGFIERMDELRKTPEQFPHYIGFPERYKNNPQTEMYENAQYMRALYLYTLFTGHLVTSTGGLLSLEERILKESKAFKDNDELLEPVLDRLCR